MYELSLRIKETAPRQKPRSITKIRRNSSSQGSSLSTRSNLSSILSNRSNGPNYNNNKPSNNNKRRVRIVTTREEYNPKEFGT